MRSCWYPLRERRSLRSSSRSSRWRLQSMGRRRCRHRESGRSGTLTFAGVAGENLGLGVSGVVAHSGVSRRARASRPTSRMARCSHRRSAVPTVRACAANLENLPVTGIYTVIAQPANGRTGTQRLWLSRDVGGVLGKRHARQRRAVPPRPERASLVRRDGGVARFFAGAWRCDEPVGPRLARSRQPAEQASWSSTRT